MNSDPINVAKKEILAALRKATTEAEWNQVCGETKSYASTLPEDERSGDYPVWWFEEVLLSGLANRKTREFGL